MLCKINANRFLFFVILKTYGILNKGKDYRNVKRMLRFYLKTFTGTKLAAERQASSRSDRNDTY